MLKFDSNNKSLVFLTPNGIGIAKIVDSDICTATWSQSILDYMGLHGVHISVFGEKEQEFKLLSQHKHMITLGEIQEIYPEYFL